MPATQMGAQHRASLTHDTIGAEVGCTKGFARLGPTSLWRAVGEAVAFPTCVWHSCNLCVCRDMTCCSSCAWVPSCPRTWRSGLCSPPLQPPALPSLPGAALPPSALSACHASCHSIPLILSSARDVDHVQCHHTNLNNSSLHTLTDAVLLLCHQLDPPWQGL